MIPLLTIIVTEIEEEQAGVCISHNSDLTPPEVIELLDHLSVVIADLKSNLEHKVN